MPKFKKRSGVSINVFAWYGEKRCINNTLEIKHKISRHVNLFFVQAIKGSTIVGYKTCMRSWNHRQLETRVKRIFVIDGCANSLAKAAA